MLKSRLCPGAFALLSLVAGAAAQMPPGTIPSGMSTAQARSALRGLAYDAPFFPGANHDPAVPTPESLLGFVAGQRAASHGEIEKCFRAWGDAGEEGNDRTRLVRHATSHEGRACFHLIITSPENMRRLDEIRGAWDKLADPRGGSAAEQDRLARQTPAVAWLAYGIHGDEMSGSDAALALAYHLTASTDEDVRKLLSEVVVIIDPVQNPDGRDRSVKQVREHAGVEPNVDDQSLVHAGYWPTGRVNHYLFDLNRDWIFGTQPETRGRIAAVARWRPMLFVDSHEMGPQDTFLFSPSREPVNPHFPPSRPDWWARFAAEQAGAFDAKGWRHYTGEWNEGWYPGYSDAWASFRGAVGMLFEQASLTHDGVRRADGSIEPYRMGVHKQLVGSLANLEALRKNRASVVRDYLEDRRRAVSAESAAGGWAVAPSGNASRDKAFVDLMLLQGFEVVRTTGAFTATGVDRMGRRFEGREMPAGTIVLPARQPEAALLAVMLDFDPRMEDAFLERERRELLRFGRSKLYDVSAWSLTMLYDVEAVRIEGDAPAGAERVGGAALARAEEPAAGSLPAVGWVVDGADDLSVTLAGRLMDLGVRCRAAGKPFAFGGAEFARGSIVVARVDNKLFPGGDEAVRDAVTGAARGLGLACAPIDTGFGAGNDAPDLGGEHFPLLEPARIALVARGTTDPNAYGEAWWTLDHEMGLRTNHLDAAALGMVDLRRYNVLIVPEVYFGDALGAAGESVRDWVKGGGTLICVGSSAATIAHDKSELTRVRLLPDVLEKLAEYELAIVREWEGRRAEGGSAGVWRAAPAKKLSYPWEGSEELPSAEELKKRDAWQSIFMPQGGAIVACRVDDRHWLTAGLREELPALYTGRFVFASDASVETPIRVGVYAPAVAEEKKDESKEGDGEEKPAPRGRVGFGATPEGHELIVRMAGLVWPEAAHRLAHAPVVTREQVGNGQVILFATDPVFRGATKGTARVFMNAAVLGPGLGASHPIRP